MYNENDELMVVSGMPEGSELYVAAVGQDGKPVNPKRVTVKKRAAVSATKLRTSPVIATIGASVSGGVLTMAPQKNMVATGLKVKVMTPSGIFEVTQVVIDGESIELSKGTGTITGTGSSVTGGTAAVGQENGDLLIEFSRPIEVERNSAVEITHTNPVASACIVLVTLTNEGPIPGVGRFS